MLLKLVPEDTRSPEVSGLFKKVVVSLHTGTPIQTPECYDPSHGGPPKNTCTYYDHYTGQIEELT